MFKKHIHINTSVSPFASRIAVSIFFFISGFNFAAFAARIPALQKQLQLNDAELGTVLAALPAGLMITMPLAGFVLSSLSSRTVMIISSIVYTILLCGLALVTKVWEAAVILFLFGAARNFFNISVNTQSIGVQALYQKSIITTFHGIWSIAALTGAALSFLLISIETSMFTHFIIVALVSLTLIALAFSYTLIQDIKVSTKKVVFALPDKPLVKLGFIGFISMVCEGTMSDWSGVYFAKVVQVEDSLVTVGYVAYLAAMVGGRFAGDWLVNKVGVKPFLQISSILIASGFLIAVFMPYLITAAIGFILIGFGVSCIMPLVFSITPTISNLPTGSAVAAISTVSYLGFLTGPPIVGYIAHAVNLKWSFVATAIISIFIYFIVYLLKNNFTQEKNRATS